MAHLGPMTDWPTLPPQSSLRRLIPSGLAEAGRLPIVIGPDAVPITDSPARQHERRQHLSGFGSQARQEFGNGPSQIQQQKAADGRENFGPKHKQEHSRQSGFVPAATPGLVKSAVMLISMSIWLPLRAAAPAGSLRGTLAPALRAVEAIAIGLPAGQQGDSDPSAQSDSGRAVADCGRAQRSTRLRPQRRPKTGRDTHPNTATGQPPSCLGRLSGAKASPQRLVRRTPERLQLRNYREHEPRLIRRIDPHLHRQRLDR